MTDSFDLHRFVNAQAPLRGDVKKGRQETDHDQFSDRHPRHCGHQAGAGVCRRGGRHVGAGFVESVLARALADDGYIENGKTSRVRGFPVHDSSVIGAVC
jgi:hypothetical protein